MTYDNEERNIIHFVISSNPALMSKTLTRCVWGTFGSRVNALFEECYNYYSVCVIDKDYWFILTKISQNRPPRFCLLF